jgi:hypothetical protein
MLLLVETLTSVVKLPLGVVVVELNRHSLELGDRGGFVARWSDNVVDVLTPDHYRILVKNHLREIYQQQTGQEPPSITLNLASHQVLDDIIGWSKLNYSSHSVHQKL